jgi:hypothetical protein
MASVEHERLISSVFDIGFRLHEELGPGLLESVYETILAGRLKQRGVSVIRQKPVNIMIDGISFVDAYRVDLFLDSWACGRVEGAGKTDWRPYPPSAQLC